MSEQLGVVERVLQGDGRRLGLQLGHRAAGRQFLLGDGREGDKRQGPRRGRVDGTSCGHLKARREVRERLGA